ncbi:hypothetical protein [Caballeronia sp. LjRoot31]
MKQIEVRYTGLFEAAHVAGEHALMLFVAFPVRAIVVVWGAG